MCTVCLQGVPYAEPPVGERRWKAPQAPAGDTCQSQASVDATQYGAKCLQWSVDGGDMIGKYCTLYERMIHTVGLVNGLVRCAVMIW